ncbi:MAG: FMN-binding negative transcriptional regulator [Ilumatobacteraceae bacterium]
MYVPTPFRPDSATIKTLIDSHATGQLITATDDGPLATLVPWVHHDDGTEYGRLLGHLARANDHWRTPHLGDALVVMSGPQGYISPSWYAAKREHGRVVPTWNKMELQLRGEFIVHDDPTWVHNLVSDLTARHESHRELPWSLDDAPSEFIDAQLRAIVGIEVRIASVNASVKMSQNRPHSDIAGIIEGLRSDGRHDLAQLVDDNNAHRTAQ